MFGAVWIWDLRPSGFIHDLAPDNPKHISGKFFARRAASRRLNVENAVRLGFRRRRVERNVRPLLDDDYPLPLSPSCKVAAE